MLSIIHTSESASSIDKRCTDCGSHDWLVGTPAGYVCQPCLDERTPSAITTLPVAVAQVADSPNVRYLVRCDECERSVPTFKVLGNFFCDDCLKGDVPLFDHPPVADKRREYRVCDDCGSLGAFYLLINTPEGCFCQPCLEERNGEPLPF